MAAFSVFFMQSPSFLALQTALQRGRGTSNCQTLFGMERIPTDNHIRTMFDPVPPETLFTMFDTTLAARGRRRARLVPAAGRPCADRATRHRVFLLAEAVVRELLGQWQDRAFPRHDLGRACCARARACAAAGAGVRHAPGWRREAGLRGSRDAPLACSPWA